MMAQRRAVLPFAAQDRLVGERKRLVEGVNHPRRAAHSGLILDVAAFITFILVPRNSARLPRFCHRGSHYGLRCREPGRRIASSLQEVPTPAGRDAAADGRLTNGNSGALRCISAAAWRKTSPAP